MPADDTPRVLLLDVMGTIIHDPFYEEIPAFFGMSMDDLLAVKHPTAWIEFEKGELDAGTYLDRFFADGRELDRAGLMRVVREGYSLLPGMGPLLAELKNLDVPMHALSNYPIWYRLIEAELRLSRFIEWSFVSCDTRVRKPHPQSYLGPCAALGVLPEEALFVDDRVANCAAAEAVGLRTVRFTDAPSLREALRALGLPLLRSA